MRFNRYIRYVLSNFLDPGMDSLPLGRIDNRSNRLYEAFSMVIGRLSYDHSAFLKGLKTMCLSIMVFNSKCLFEPFIQRE